VPVDLWQVKTSENWKIVDGRRSGVALIAAHSLFQLEPGPS
jgi:hypothetical protein